MISSSNNYSSSSPPPPSRAKQYFSTFLADDYVRPCHLDLVSEILKFKPQSVFEFGCGQGKNLNILLHTRPKTLKRSVWGIDLSRLAVNEAAKKGRREYVFLGDENTLPKLDTRSIDVCFTCSVLDHIDNELIVDHVIADLKRICRKGVVLFEPQRNTPETYYYKHDYVGDYDFTKKRNYEYYSAAAQGGDESTYYMYIWKK